MTNEYTPRWFASFMDTMPEPWTSLEVNGVCRRLPLPGFRRVLDVCCGTGRHAARLAELGYEVTGVDRDEAALARARIGAPRATFVLLVGRDTSARSGRAAVSERIRTDAASTSNVKLRTSKLSSQSFAVRV